jgi:mannose PTS system EIIC component
VGFGVIGVAAWQILSVGNAGWAHLDDRYAAAGNLDGIIRSNYYAQVGTFILRGILPFFVLLLGSSFAQSFIDFLNNQVPWLVQYLGILGGALPAVGIAILLLQISPNASLLVWFLVGWVLIVYGHVPLVGVAVVGALVAVLHYLYLSRIDLGPMEAQSG